jgi:hypothetical protein
MHCHECPLHCPLHCLWHCPLYQYADLQTYENFSRAYTWATRRVSHFVWCQYEEEGENVQNIADVHLLVVDECPDGEPNYRISFGLCDLYKLALVQRSIGEAWLAEPAFKSLQKLCI